MDAPSKALSLNIANTELERLLLPHIEAIAAAYAAADFIEVTRLGVLVHG